MDKVFIDNVFFVLGAFVTLTVTGFVRVKICLNKIHDKSDFIENYIKNFRLYCETLGLKTRQPDARKSREYYDYLMRKSAKMQRMLGASGLVTMQRIPLIYRNYPVILNGIPEIDTIVFDNNSGITGHETVDTSVRLIETLLVSLQGDLEEGAESLRKNLFNPASLFKEGVDYVVNLIFAPIILINIIEEKYINKFQQFVSYSTMIYAVFSFIVSAFKFI